MQKLSKTSTLAIFTQENLSLNYSRHFQSQNNRIHVKFCSLLFRMLTRFAFPSLHLPPPLPDDVDLGLPETVAMSEDSNQSAGSSFVSVATDEDSNQGNNRRSVPSRRAKDRSSFQFRGDLESSSFLGEFDPGSSEREKRKLKKKPMLAGSSRAKPAVYDDKGMIIHFQKDICDCLEEECPGQFNNNTAIASCNHR